jgi:hypothetical protein
MREEGGGGGGEGGKGGGGRWGKSRRRRQKRRNTKRGMGEGWRSMDRTRTTAEEGDSNDYFRFLRAGANPLGTAGGPFFFPFWGSKRPRQQKECNRDRNNDRGTGRTLKKTHPRTMTRLPTGKAQYVEIHKRAEEVTKPTRVCQTETTTAALRGITQAPCPACRQSHQSPLPLVHASYHLPELSPPFPPT